MTLDQSGQWTFDLTVQYRHDAFSQPGVPYATSAQEIKNISSVSAAFTISPSSPLHNQIITLTSTSAAQAGATLDFDWDVLDPVSGSIVHSLSFCDGVHPVNYQCVIPAETLTWDIYDFRLILTNTATTPDDVSQALIEDFEVFNGNIQIDFNISNPNPEIGDFVGFNITGVAADDIERAVWTYGGTGCDGTTGYTCVEPSFPSCDVAAVAYNSGGTKTVRVTVTTTGGVVQPQVSHIVTVQNTGSCGGTTCSYGISPTTRTFTSDGGNGTISVSTQTGCPWTASEGVTWITITGGSSGNGSGTVSYQVAANTGAARTANITVAGKTHTVSQEATASICNYGLPTHSAVFDPPGGDGSFQVTASDTGCTWQASTAANWILITNGANHVGTSPLNFTVAENDTPHQRSATIDIVGSGGFTDHFTVTQNHPWIPVNFDWDIFSPEIGETVTFSTDPRLEVLSWTFTSADCQGNTPVITCSGVAGECNEVEWTFPGSGPQEITLETTTGSQTKGLVVKTTGECPPYCGKDGPPDASFVITPSPALEDQEITFTDTSSGGLKILATGLTWSPTSPEIGEIVHFTITGHSGDVRAEWNFGENGCGGFPQIQVCEPLYGDCLDWTFKFASGGDKTVSVTVKNPSTGAVIGSTSRTVTVQNVGSCDGVPTCTYSLNPSNWPLPGRGRDQ